MGYKYTTLSRICQAIYTYFYTLSTVLRTHYSLYTHWNLLITYLIITITYKVYPLQTYFFAYSLLQNNISRKLIKMLKVFIIIYLTYFFLCAFARKILMFPCLINQNPQAGVF